MKVIRVDNLKTKQFYFAVVHDNDNRTDPLKYFSDTLIDMSDTRHFTYNVNRTILKQHLSKEQASVDLIMLKKSNPACLNNVVTNVSIDVPVVDVKVVDHPKNETIFVNDNNVNEQSDILNKKTSKNKFKKEYDISNDDI